MKDSIGSTLLLKIFTVFLVVYIIFMASILNYTKTFRVKNQIINIINRHGGYTDEAKSEISNYFSKSTIYGTCTELSGNAKFGEDTDNRCEIKAYSMESPVSGSYYKVRLYVTFMFPLIKQTLRIPITGETKILYKLAPPGSQKVQYTIVDRDPPPDTLYKFDIKTCTPPGGGGKYCCSKTVCDSAYTWLLPGQTYNGLTNSNSTKCRCKKSDGSTTTPSLNRSAPGRVPDTTNGVVNDCYYCVANPTACKKTELSFRSKSFPGSATPAQTRSLSIYLIDSDRVGVKYCTVKDLATNNTISAGISYNDTGSTSYVSINFSFDACTIGRDVNSVSISCYDATGRVIKLEGGSTSITAKINIKKPVNCCSVANCKTCKPDSFNKCQTCNDGYYTTPSGSCSECKTGCATCSNGTSCNTCKSGYDKSEGVCKRCFCLNTSATSKANCYVTMNYTRLKCDSTSNCKWSDSTPNCPYTFYSGTCTCYQKQYVCSKKFFDYSSCTSLCTANNKNGICDALGTCAVTSTTQSCPSGWTGPNPSPIDASTTKTCGRNSTCKAACGDAYYKTSGTCTKNN